MFLNFWKLFSSRQKVKFFQQTECLFLHQFIKFFFLRCRQNFWNFLCPLFFLSFSSKFLTINITFDAESNTSSGSINNILQKIFLYYAQNPNRRQLPFGTQIFLWKGHAFFLSFSGNFHSFMMLILP